MATLARACVHPRPTSVKYVSKALISERRHYSKVNPVNHNPFSKALFIGIVASSLFFFSVSVCLSRHNTRAECSFSIFLSLTLLLASLVVSL